MVRSPRPCEFIHRNDKVCGATPTQLVVLGKAADPPPGFGGMTVYGHYCEKHVAAMERQPQQTAS